MAVQPRILLTRPQAQSLRFAESLGLPCLISPLMAPRFLTPVVPPHAAVILTSETGAEAAARLVAPTFAFCVGDRTASTARSLGFQASSAAGDAEALIAHILAAPVSPLLHLRGREARGEIAARLTSAGVPTAEAVAYAQEEQPLSPEALAALHGTAPLILPLFSPRSATLLARVVPRAPLTVVAMSAAVAEAARGLDPDPLIATRPDAAAMREATLAAVSRRPSA